MVSANQALSNRPLNDNEVKQGLVTCPEMHVIINLLLIIINVGSILINVTKSTVESKRKPAINRFLVSKETVVLRRWETKRSFSIDDGNGNDNATN